VLLCYRQKIVPHQISIYLGVSESYQIIWNAGVTVERSIAGKFGKKSRLPKTGCAKIWICLHDSGATFQSREMGLFAVLRDRYRETLFSSVMAHPREADL
jgi:hypothetical protein